MVASFRTPTHIGTVKRSTTNYELQVPYFDTPNWGQYVEADLDAIDGLLFAAMRLANVVGIWQNGHVYTDGDRVVDSLTGAFWECEIGHTSDASATFAADRVAHPTYWTQLSTGFAEAADVFYDNADSGAASVNVQEAIDELFATSGGVTDGDKGEIVVTGGVWTLETSAILTRLLTVDGAASALDSDLLDGQHGAYYLARGNHTGTQLAATISDFSTAADARISASVGVTTQAYNANLTSYATVTPSAFTLTLLDDATASNFMTTLGLTANGQSLVTAADYAAMRTLLSLVPGTNFYSVAAADAAFQPKDSDLTTIAGLTATTDNFIVSVASAWASRTPAQVKTTLAIAQADVSGLTTASTPLFAGVDIGNADTSLARVAAGRVSVEGTELQKQPTSDGIVARTAAGTAAARTITGTANEITVGNGDGVAANPTLSLAAAAKVVGRQEFWIGAGAMKTRASSGAEEATYDSGSNDISLNVLAYDQTAAEYAHFEFGMPNGWDEGTVTFIPYWTADAGTATQTCIFSLAGVAISNDDPMNATRGTAGTSSDALLAVGDLHIGPESAAITIGGSPAANDLVVFEVARDISDTLAADAKLIGIKLVLTFASANDS